MAWFVYILRCADNSFYTGITTEVDRRMREHERGVGSKYVAAKGFDKVLYVLEVSTRSEASKLEYAAKQLPKFEKLVFFREHEARVFSAFDE